MSKKYYGEELLAQADYGGMCVILRLLRLLYNFEQFCPRVIDTLQEVFVFKLGIHD